MEVKKNGSKNEIKKNGTEESSFLEIIHTGVSCNERTYRSNCKISG